MCGSPNSSPTTIRPPGLDHAAQLAQRGVLVGDLAQHRDQIGAVEAVVADRAARGRRRASARCSRCPARARAPHVWSSISCCTSSTSRRPSGREPARHRERVVAGARAHLEQRSPGARLEDLAQALARDERVRRLDPEALRVGAGRRVPAPPERRARPRAAGSSASRAAARHHASSGAGTISRMWRRASISTGAFQSRPEPSRATAGSRPCVKNSWSRRFT